VALRKTVQLLEKEFPKVADVLENNSYVDDIITSESSVEDTCQLAHDIDHLLQKVGFAIKHWIISGSQDNVVVGIKLLNTETGEVFGSIWKPEDDVFTFKVLLNFTEKGNKWTMYFPSHIVMHHTGILHSQNE
jgi:hypothetical protein